MDINNKQLKNGIKTQWITAVIVALMLTACGEGGGSKTATTNSIGNNVGTSNIPYLRQNHRNYSEYGSNLTPTPTKDANKKSIDWNITAKTEYDASKLAEHIRFMVQKLKEGSTPRAWDKLFLMEAYMKVNHYYTTSIEQSDTIVVINKQATNSCAYSVISAHSDAVSGDFFGRGDIRQDYSSIAEDILNSSACSALKNDIKAYIQANQRNRRQHKFYNQYNRGYDGAN